MPREVARSGDGGLAAWRVWDTAHVPEREAFSLYREAVCESFLRLSPRRPDRNVFSARVEHLAVGEGAINRVHTAPHDVIRNAADVARIDGEYLHLNFQISGRYLLEQGGRTSDVRSGDAVLFGTGTPFRLRMHTAAHTSLTSLLIPRRTVADAVGRGIGLDNVLVSQLPNGVALRSCLAALSARLSSGSLREIALLKNAAVSLLCAALACTDAQAKPLLASPNAEPPLLTGVKALARARLADPGLSAAEAAVRFGISRRYVDRLFQQAGTTFERFVLAERLRGARLDLVDPARRRDKIAAIAYRWGFRDLSMFHRNFKAAYGVTPGEARNAN